jgi:hypothetical protein
VKNVVCPYNAAFNVNTYQCECVKSGDYFINGECRACASNEVFNGKSCVCRDDCILIGSVCIPKCGSNQIWSASFSKCVCDNNCYLKGSECFPCPRYSKLGSDGKCSCDFGYIYNSYSDQCVQIACPANSSPSVSSNGVVCVCDSGYGMNANNVCEKINQNQCPSRSVFNVAKLKCECTVTGENMIGNECSSCGLNQGWDGSQVRLQKRTLRNQRKLQDLRLEHLLRWQ